MAQAFTYLRVPSRPSLTSEPTGTAAVELGSACYHRALADTAASTGARMAGIFQLAPLTHPAWWAPVGRDSSVGGDTQRYPQDRQQTHGQTHDQ